MRRVRRRDPECLGIGNRLEVVAGPQQLDTDQDPAKRQAKDGGRHYQRTGKTERSNEDVSDRRALGGLL